MPTKPRKPAPPKPPRWYRGADIPMSVIRRFARDVAQRFQPDKIILFGSYAYGNPHADSDVDILVVMPARNQLDQALRVELACDPPFPLDLFARTPDKFRLPKSEGDPLVREAVESGKVLYEAQDAAVDSKGRGRFRGSGKARPRKRRVA